MSFQVAGIWRFTLMLRDEQTNSIWSHVDGVAVAGELKGAVLPRHPAYQMIYRDWVKAHPESEVLTYGENPTHRDGRHGHGARDDLGRIGIRAGRAFGLTPTDLDDRLPEHEMVLGIWHPPMEKAYPLFEVQRSGGVVNDRASGDPIVVWAPRLETHWMAAFHSSLPDGEELTFHRRGGEIYDDQTRSRWHIEGRANSGPLSGFQLTPLDSLFLQWHAWCGFHPDTEIYVADGDLSATELGTNVFDKFIAALVAEGYDLALQGQIPIAMLPNLAVCAIRLRINADPFHCFEFRDVHAAQEFLLVANHLTQVGRFVLKSQPEEQYADVAQLKPMPDEEVAWSHLIGDPAFLKLAKLHLPSAQTEAPDGRAFPAVLAGLKSHGFPADAHAMIETLRLPPAAETGFEVTICGDPFLVYRFGSHEFAREFSAWHGRSLAVGEYVFRSNPPVQYKHMGLKSIDLPIEEINWSELLWDENFTQNLYQILIPESA